MTTLLSAKAAAEFLGVSSGLLATWRMRGDGPPFAKLGRRVVYDAADLAKLVEQSKRTRTSEVPSARHGCAA